LSWTYPTGSWEVAALYPQAIEETTYGVAPSNGAFFYPGPITEMNDSLETGSLKYRQIGSRDIHSMIKTGEMYAMEMTWNPISTDMFDYCINLPGVGTKNIGKSLTFAIKQKMFDGAADKWTLYKGAVCESIEVEITNTGAVECSATFICKDITAPATTSGLPGTPVFITVNPGTPIWTNITPGPNPLTWNASVFSTSSFGFSVTNNPEVIKPNGELVAKFVKPTLRDIEFEFNAWYEQTGTNVLLTDAKALTARTLEYKMSATNKVSITGAYSTNWETSRATGATEHQMENVSGTGTTAVMATY
jgi:hypothetical protein